VEETTAPVEETTAPVEKTPAPVEETPAPVEETTAPVEETTAPVEETTAPIPETTAPVETGPLPPMTSVKEGQFIYIERDMVFDRWGYQYQNGWRLTSPYYNRTYAFSEGFGCTVDANGRLIFLGQNGYRAIPSTSFTWNTEWTYMTNQNSRYVRASYAEPLYRDLSALGHYYFDEGLVRVRKLERDYSYRHIINADEDLLLDTKGNVFEIPAGYTLAGYADGILLLERQGKYGYYHKDGYWLAQPIYTYAQPFMEGLGVIGFAGGKVGAIDVAGNVVIPFTYEYISAPSSGLMAVFSKKDGWSVLVKVVPERSEA